MPGDGLSGLYSDTTFHTAPNLCVCLHNKCTVQGTYSASFIDCKPQDKGNLWCFIQFKHQQLQACKPNGPKKAELFICLAC